MRGICLILSRQNMYWEGTRSGIEVQFSIQGNLLQSRLQIDLADFLTSCSSLMNLSLPRRKTNNELFANSHFRCQGYQDRH
jgi:hypothetical protein